MHARAAPDFCLWLLRRLYKLQNKIGLTELYFQKTGSQLIVTTNSHS